MLVLDYELSKLIPAKYNPRVLVDEDFEVLKKSIAHGLLKPVIATEKGKIIAGHQRSKSAIAIGMTHGPVFVISSSVCTSATTSLRNSNVSPLATCAQILSGADSLVLTL